MSSFEDLGPTPEFTDEELAMAVMFMQKLPELRRQPDCSVLGAFDEACAEAGIILDEDDRAQLYAAGVRLNHSRPAVEGGEV